MGHEGKCTALLAMLFCMLTDELPAEEFSAPILKQKIDK